VVASDHNLHIVMPIFSQIAFNDLSPRNVFSKPTSYIGIEGEYLHYCYAGALQSILKHYFNRLKSHQEHETALRIHCL